MLKMNQNESLSSNFKELELIIRFLKNKNFFF